MSFFGGNWDQRVCLTDPHQNRNTYKNRNTDRHGYLYADGEQDAHRQSYLDALQDADAVEDGYADPNGHLDADADYHPNADGDTGLYPHRHRSTYRHTHIHPDRGANFADGDAGAAVAGRQYTYDPTKGGAGGDGSRFLHPRSAAKWGIW